MIRLRHHAYDLVRSVVEGGSERVEDELLLCRLARWLVDRGYETETRRGLTYLEKYAAVDPDEVRAGYEEAEL